jgi:hypothetical protein
MALFYFRDDFEMGTLERWANPAGASVVVGTGSQAIGGRRYCECVTGPMAKYTAGAERYFAMRTRWAATTDAWLTIRLSGSDLLYLDLIYTDGKYKIRARNGQGTILGMHSDSFTLSLNSKYLLQLLYVPHPSAGILQIKVGDAGTTVLDLSGIDTTNIGGATTQDEMAFAAMDLDSVAVGDDWMGDWPHLGRDQFLEGFEGGHVLAWDEVSITTPNGGIKNAEPVGMIDDCCCYLGPGDYLRKKYYAISPMYRCCGQIWYRPEVFAEGQWIFAWRSGTTVLAHLRVDPVTHTLKLYQGDSEVAFLQDPRSKTYPLTLGQRCKIVFKIYLNGTTVSSADVWADGVHAIWDGSGQVAALFGDGFQIGGPNCNGYFDNIILGDSELPTAGDQRVISWKPSAAGDLAELAPSLAPNFDCVNDVPYSADRFVASNDLDKMDLYQVSKEVAALIESGATSIHISAVVTEEGTPTPRQIQLVLKQGSLLQLSPYQPVRSCVRYCFDSGESPLPSWDSTIQVGVKTRV